MARYRIVRKRNIYFAQAKVPFGWRLLGKSGDYLWTNDKADKEFVQHKTADSARLTAELYHTQKTSGRALLRTPFVVVQEFTL